MHAPVKKNRVPTPSARLTIRPSLAEAEMAVRILILGR